MSFDGTGDEQDRRAAITRPIERRSVEIAPFDRNFGTDDFARADMTFEFAKNAAIRFVFSVGERVANVFAKLRCKAAVFLILEV